MIDRTWTHKGNEYRIRSTAEAFENDSTGIGTSILEVRSEYGWSNLDPMDCPDLLFSRLAEILDEEGETIE